MTADPAPRPLAVFECLRLLRSAPMGRIVYSKNALPAVEPVRFTLDDGLIFAAVSSGSVLPAAVHQSIVALQADQFSEGPEHWAVDVVKTAIAGPQLEPARSVQSRCWTARSPA